MSGQVPPTGSLQRDIDALATAGHLGAEHASILHKIRFLGNVAARDLDAPNGDVIATASRIVRALLDNVFIVPQLAARGLPADKVSHG